MERIDDVLPYAPPTDIPQGVTEEVSIILEILKEHDMKTRNYIIVLMSNDFIALAWAL